MVFLKGLCIKQHVRSGLGGIKPEIVNLHTPSGYLHFRKATVSGREYLVSGIWTVWISDNAPRERTWKMVRESTVRCCLKPLHDIDSIAVWCYFSVERTFVTRHWSVCNQRETFWRRSLSNSFQQNIINWKKTLIKYTMKIHVFLFSIW